MDALVATANKYGLDFGKNLAGGITDAVSTVSAATKNLIPTGSRSGAITKYQSGTGYVPKTEAALIHQGEIVIPPGPSGQLRRGLASLTKGSSGGSIWDQLIKFLTDPLGVLGALGD